MKTRALISVAEENGCCQLRVERIWVPASDREEIWALFSRLLNARFASEFLSPHQIVIIRCERNLLAAAQRTF